MRDIGVQLQPAWAVVVLILEISIFVEARSTMIAEASAQVILLAAALAAVAQLARWHGQEQAVVAFDQFHIANDERVIESQRAECLETPAVAVAQTDAHFR